MEGVRMNRSQQIPYHRPFGGTPDTANHADAEAKQLAAEELSQAISSSHDILCSAKTVFPLTLFPDTITVDRAKVSVTKRNFFVTGETITIRIEDILNITATVGPFFGDLKITTKFFNPEKPYVINKLHRQDVLRIKRILQGYIIARQNNVDVSQFSTPELTRKLDELGQVGPQDRL